MRLFFIAPVPFKYLSWTGHEREEKRTSFSVTSVFGCCLMSNVSHMYNVPHHEKERRNAMYSPKKNSLVAILLAGCFLLPVAGSSAADEQDRGQEMRELRQQLRSACRESAQSFCADARGGRERLRCLLDSYEDLPAGLPGRVG
jgi:hypothetical protein